MAILLSILSELLQAFGVDVSNSFMVFLSVSVEKILNFYGMLLKPIAWLLWSNR